MLRTAPMVKPPALLPCTFTMGNQSKQGFSNWLYFGIVYKHNQNMLYMLRQEQCYGCCWTNVFTCCKANGWCLTCYQSESYNRIRQQKGTEAAPLTCYTCGSQGTCKICHSMQKLSQHTSTTVWLGSSHSKTWFSCFRWTVQHVSKVLSGALLWPRL